MSKLTDFIAAHDAEDQAAALALTSAQNQAALVPGLTARVAELEAQLKVVPNPPPTTLFVPPKYKEFWRADLSRNEGWTSESGKPSNAEGVDRPSNATFGQGPLGKSAKLLINKDANGVVYTCDLKALFKPTPNYHWTRWVIEKDASTSGAWPGLWERPITGDGEIDHWEEMPGNAAHGWPVDAGTLHTTPYDATHKQLQRALPDMTKAGVYTLDFELAVGVARWYVNNVKVAEITKAQFDAVSSNRWDVMFGNSAKKWYMRMTQQAGGTNGGTISASFTKWQMLVHELSVFVPA